MLIEDVLKVVEQETQVTKDDLDKSDIDRAYLKGQIEMIEWIKSLMEEQQ